MRDITVFYCCFLEVMTPLAPLSASKQGNRTQLRVERMKTFAANEERASSMSVQKKEQVLPIYTVGCANDHEFKGVISLNTSLHFSLQ